MRIAIFLPNWVGDVVMATPAVSDEVVLKGGKKIVGTIVGFENGMFRVETEFGYALVRKDKVETINITSGGEKAAPAKPATKAVGAERPDFRDPVKRDLAPLQEQPAPIVAPEKPVEPATPPATAPPVAAKVAPPPAPPPKAVVPPPEPSHPLDEPLPSGLAEHVQGTSYYSDTFHFVMFKPLDWKLYEEISREKISAIVAMSDENDRTLLIVDRTVWSGAPDLKNDVVDAKIKGMVENYAKISEAAVEADGQPAIRRSFTGLVDGVEWHGVSAHIAQGNAVFGIIGMTSAENYQFEEAVFNKIIKSFHFIGPAAESGQATGQGVTSRK